MLLNISQRKKLEHQKLERLTQVDKEKTKSQWSSSQKKADFNRKMRQKLKEGIHNLSDLVLLLESLPPNVLVNAKLIEDLPKVIEFVEVYLKKADLRPVAEHESGELRTFRNYAICIENTPDVDKFHNSIYYKPITIINNKQYLLQSYNITASASERRNCDILKKHIEYLQRYVDPGIMVDDDTYAGYKRIMNDISKDMDNKVAIIGQCSSSSSLIHEGKKFPTKQPCNPRALIDGKLYDIPITQKETNVAGEKPYVEYKPLTDDERERRIRQVLKGRDREQEGKEA